MLIDPRKILEMWSDCEVSILPELNWAVTKIEEYLPIYDKITDSCGVPNYMVGCIHYREANFDFRTHLANGDPLFNSDGTLLPTRNEPKGLGPFSTWNEGAIAALKYNELDKKKWDIVNSLINLERYNGLGYRKHGINSPYVWSMTNHYSSGKYKSDGKFDDSKKDLQAGCAAILKILRAKGLDIN